LVILIAGSVKKEPSATFSTKLSQIKDTEVYFDVSHPSHLQESAICHVKKAKPVPISCGH
jgi:hypothetical protein